jgi:hypothetical protein
VEGKTDRQKLAESENTYVQLTNGRLRTTAIYGVLYGNTFINGIAGAQETSCFGFLDNLQGSPIFNATTRIEELALRLRRLHKPFIKIMRCRTILLKHHDIETM